MNTNKRVLMLSWEYPPRIIGGLARVVCSLSRELANFGWDVHVVTADHPGTPEHESDGQVKVHRVKNQTDTTPDFLSWVSRLNIGLLQYAIQLQKEMPFSIIHAHDWMVTDAAWTMKTGFNIPLISTIHATEAGRMHGIHNDLQHYIHQIEWRLTYESWRVIVNSHHMHAELQHLFALPTNKTIIIPNGADVESFSINFDRQHLRNSLASPSQRIVLYVGRLVREKGVQILLDAAPKVINACPDTKFIIVGTGYYMDELKQQAYNLGIDHHINFLGYVDDEELRKLYNIADAVCIPSLYEPFGIVALEAMAARVPVVTSDTGGLRDFVENMITGITTYTGDSGSLAWGLLEVLRNQELTKNIVRKAYERVSTIYNWKVIARQTSEIYTKIIEESKNSHNLQTDKTMSQPVLNPRSI
jgi:glycogen synthase